MNISGSTGHQVAGLFETRPREPAHVTPAAPEMYDLERIRPELSADAEGWTPNERFWQAGRLG